MESEQGWSKYWDARHPAGCLPSAAAALDAQKQVWEKFARSLPKAARAIDLGTGGGNVPKWMAATRPDLKLIGVDSAAQLPPAPRGVTLKAAVAMEHLPFRDAWFGAATSQFGFEYADTDATAAELGRVLKPGASILMLIHHRDSLVLTHNMARRDAVRWAIGPGSWLEKAKRFAGACARMPLPIPAHFQSAIDEARRLYPSQSVAEEIGTGILQRLASARDAAHMAALLSDLEREAVGELARLDALDRSASDSQGIETITRQLSSAGLAIEPALPLALPGSSEPLAWIVAGVRET